MSCDHDFFQDSLCTGDRVDPGLEKRFHQEKPLLNCPLPWGNYHPCPRCSLECRSCWAGKEAAILITYLDSLPEGIRVYVGVLKVEDDITVNDHRTIRKKFLEQITNLARSRNAVIKIYVISELDESERCHYHYAMTSTTEVMPFAVKKLWSKACTGWPTIVQHDIPRSMKACAKYAFKDMISPGFVRLFKKKSLRLTWGHTGRSGFYPLGKEHYWRQYLKKKPIEKQEKKNHEKL